MVTKSVWIDKDNNKHYMPMYWYPTGSYGSNWYFVGYERVIREK